METAGGQEGPLVAGNLFPQLFPQGIRGAETMTTLDQKTVANLKLDGDDRERIFRDDDLHGFGIRVRFDSNDRLCKTWCVQYRIDGKQRRQNIGKFPRMNAATARTKAGAWLNKVHEGTDPAGERQAERVANKLTFSKAVAEYLAVKRREGEVRDSSYGLIELYLTGKYFESLHSMPVSKVTNSHVNTALNAIATAPSRSQAQRKLSTFFVWAVMEGHAPDNPVAKTKTVKAGAARERVLTEAEIRTLWNCCKDDDLGRIIKLLLLTGCRAREIGGLRFSWLDLDKGTMTIPGEYTKNGREHKLTLPALALQIIKEIPKRDGRDFLFGQWAEGFTNWKDARDRLADGLPQWTIHDLRRTAATHMAELGIQPHIIEACLNHVSGHKGGIAGIYNRASYKEPMAKALERLADHAQRIVTGNNESNIVPMQRPA
jgi:integrase